MCLSVFYILGGFLSLLSISHTHMAFRIKFPELVTSHSTGKLQKPRDMRLLL